MEHVSKLFNFQTTFTDPRRLALAAGSTAALILASSLIYYQVHQVDPQQEDAERTDPKFLKEHSRLVAFHVDQTGFTYPGIRVFHHEHPKASSFPPARPLPLLVFVHGLGGSALQYHSLLQRLTSIAPCLAIDLPGCGRSVLAPSDLAAYTPKALTLLLGTIIETYRDKAHEQRIVLIGHSYGCGLVAAIASRSIPEFEQLADLVQCAVALCPKGNDLTPNEAGGLRRLLSIPTPVFDILRYFDRRGGLESQSVTRATGVDADVETKKMQVIYNLQSRTPTFRRIARGLLPECERLGSSGELWRSVTAHCLVIAGEADRLTPPNEATIVVDMIKSGKAERGQNVHATVERVELPRPAAHTLLFSPATVPVVSGLIQNFLVKNVDERLSGAWQLINLSSSSAPEHKWEMKNLAKWQKIKPVSDLIGGVFRAMKTMRQGDNTHCPSVLAQNWHDTIGVVVDISHESPSYKPEQLEDCGIRYHKFPTISKQPPSNEEIENFIAVIDRLREELSSCATDASRPKEVAVHCHYGFNRTGYLIVCYLVERLDWKLQDAIDEFARARSPGIKHGYFVDTLFVRYYTRVQLEGKSSRK
ncbi:MAG: hypothetical protein M1828_007160 [Chrysothrix sp. TS-e1954]|nr:MAG: hypothetical protein M1828_007160 [Chrysothrix sp. TS-e1954]